MIRKHNGFSALVWKFTAKWTVKSRSADKNCFHGTQVCIMVWRCFFLEFVICINFFFSAFKWTLRSLFSASNRRMSASQDAMTHSGYISAYVLILPCITNDFFNNLFIPIQDALPFQWIFTFLLDSPSKIKQDHLSCLS